MVTCPFHHGPGCIARGEKKEAFEWGLRSSQRVNIALQCADDEQDGGRTGGAPGLQIRPLEVFRTDARHEEYPKAVGNVQLGVVPMNCLSKTN